VPRYSQTWRIYEKALSPNQLFTTTFKGVLKSQIRRQAADERKPFLPFKLYLPISKVFYFFKGRSLQRKRKASPLKNKKQFLLKPCFLALFVKSNNLIFSTKKAIILI